MPGQSNLRTIPVLFLLLLLFSLSCSGSDPVIPDNQDPSGNTAGSFPSMTSGDLEDPSAPDGLLTTNRDIEPYAPDEILLTLNNSLAGDILSSLSPAETRDAVNSLLSSHGLSFDRTVHPGWTTIYLVKITDGTSVPDKIDEILALPIVDSAEPNITFEFCDSIHTPNDPFYENPNDLDEDPRTTVREMWGPAKLGANVIWDETIGNPSVVVCVLDSGIQVWHEDLENVVWTNVDEIPDNEIDDDNNGYVDDFYGWDMYEDDNDITEYNGSNYYHGTACAGVVAAEQDNELGCTGIAPGVQVMGVRIGFGYTFLSEVLDGVAYARDNGAKVLSMSFSSNTYSNYMNTSMYYAWEAGMVLVAAASNDDSQDLRYPACYNSVMCIGGTTPFYERWNYQPIDEIRISKSAGFDWGSNYGPQLDIMGYGDFYITTHGGNDHKYWDGANDFFFRGTSNATPVVAGVLALMISLHPDETNEWLRERITYLSDDLDEPGFDIQTGWGRVNALRACYGNDRYEDEADPDGCVDLVAHENVVMDSIHAVEWPWNDTSDMYKFTADQDGFVNFFLDIWTWGEDLDMFVYSDPSGDPSTIIDQSAMENHAANSWEVAGTAVSEGQTVYIEVVPREIGDSTSYTLSAEYVEPALTLEVETYDPGFIHVTENDQLIGHMDFSSTSKCHLTELIFNVQGGMPGSRLAGLSLYKDTYNNDTFDSLDEHIADASIAPTGRAIFSGIYEEITSSLSPVRYFLIADIAGVTEDAFFELVLSNYKHVTTYEGLEIAKEDFPIEMGPWEVGVDIDPPTWDSTEGVQAVTGRLKSIGLFWNNASDPRTPPVKYNVYWTTELPFDFASAEHQNNVSFSDSGDYDHRWVIPDLINGQEYHVAVRAQDQAGNEDDNTVYMSVTPDDIPDPTWPQTLATYNTEGDAREVDVDPVNHRLFVADSDGGVVILDVSNPFDPQLISIAPASGVKGVDYHDGLVYAAAQPGLLILDPDTPDTPELIAEIPLSNALRVRVIGNYAYVTDGGTNLMPVDITDPSNPVSYPLVTSGNTGYAIHENAGYMYVATMDHPRIFDLTDPSAPSQIANFGNSQGHDILIDNDRIYAAFWGGKKVILYDNTQINSPPSIGEWTSNSGKNGSCHVMLNGHLYFGTQSWGIEVLNVDDPGDIYEVGQVQTKGPDGMETDGTYIYTAENGDGIRIIF